MTPDASFLHPSDSSTSAKISIALSVKFHKGEYCLPMSTEPKSPSNPTLAKHALLSEPVDEPSSVYLELTKTGQANCREPAKLIVA